jgi:hypothetical protein
MRFSAVRMLTPSTMLWKWTGRSLHPFWLNCGGESPSQPKPSGTAARKRSLLQRGPAGCARCPPLSGAPGQRSCEPVAVVLQACMPLCHMAPLQCSCALSCVHQRCACLMSASRSAVHQKSVARCRVWPAVGRCRVWPAVACWCMGEGVEIASSVSLPGWHDSFWLGRWRYLVIPRAQFIVESDRMQDMQS